MKVNGYHVKDYGQAVKRYVQTMDLKDDPVLIAEYRRRHSREGATSDEKWQMMERMFYLYE